MEAVQAGGTPPPSSSITSVTASCTPATVIAGQTSQCSTTVQGTGSFNSAVTWSVQGSGNGSINSSGLYSAPATVQSAMQVTVTATSVGDPTKTGSAAVTVTAAWVQPSITTQPLNQAVTAPQTATFTAAADGNPVPTVQWSKNGVAIPGATSPSYTTPPTTVADNGNKFKATFTNSAGFAITAEVTLTVNAAPTGPSITTQPSNLAVVVGQPANLCVVATGTAPLNYQWSRNGAAITGANASCFAIAVTTPSDNGSVFTVVVSNSAGSVTSAPATLTVNALWCFS